YAYVVAAFQAPPSSDYVPGLEEPEQAPLSPEFVLEPVYPEFMPLEDDVLPAEEQPLPTTISPTADSPGYIPESDPEEDDNEDHEEDPADYPTDRDEEEEEPPKDEADDEDEEEDDEEEEEHPALTDSDPPPVHHTTARISIPALAPVPFLFEEEIPSPPLPASLPLPVSSPLLRASPTHPLGYRAVMIRIRAETPSTSHPLSSSTPPSGTSPLLPIPLPTSSPPLLLPSTDYRAGVSEVTLPPQKRLCIAPDPRYEIGKSSSAPTARPSGGFRVDYGFVVTLDDEIRRDPKRDVGYAIIDNWDEMLVGMPGAPTTDDIKLDEAQDAIVVLSGRLNLLQRDKRSHAYTALLMDREARHSLKAWGRLMDVSDTTHSEVRALRTTVLAQQIKIAALQAANRARQAQLVQTLRLMSTLQTQVTTL
ncbi:hypothetical protein Tco_1527535, partial [Tanacetum coccineum]